MMYSCYSCWWGCWLVVVIVVMVYCVCDRGDVALLVHCDLLGVVLEMV